MKNKLFLFSQAIGDVSNKGPAMAHKAEDEALVFFQYYFILKYFFF